MSKIYRESITTETQDEIISFLQDNPNINVSYATKRAASALKKKAYEEMMNSTEGFREEFDAIIKTYKDEISKKTQESIKFKIMNETNGKLKVLYSRYEDNPELRKLLEKLSPKYSN